MPGQSGNRGNRTAAAKLEGATFDLLTVESREGTSPKGEALWRCRCRCGAIVAGIPTSQLHGRKGISCGRPECRQQEAGNARHHTPTARVRQRRLTEAVWPRRCRTCGVDFLGTARQVYCPDHSSRIRRRLGKS